MKFWQRWYRIFGGRLYIRFEPDAFLEAERRIANLIDDGKLIEAKDMLLSLPCDWQNDREFIRLFAMCEMGYDSSDDCLGCSEVGALRHTCGK